MIFLRWLLCKVVGHPYVLRFPGRQTWHRTAWRECPRCGQRADLDGKPL